MTTTDSNNSPEIIGPPPEPPVGVKYRDCVGDVWEHRKYGWVLNPEDGDDGTDSDNWAYVLQFAPLIRIDPDPWPTAPLIVATFLGKRCVFGRTVDGNYDSPTGGLEADSDFHRDALTDVVPMTVVPAAEWEALAQTVRSLTAPGTKGSLLNQAQMLVAATDALGLDQ